MPSVFKTTLEGDTLTILAGMYEDPEPITVPCGVTVIDAWPGVYVKITKDLDLAGCDLCIGGIRIIRQKPEGGVR